MPDIIFMCISKEILLSLCDLFPQTADNIKRRSLERRQRFMNQKNTNSRSYQKNQKALEQQQKKDGQVSDNQKNAEAGNEENLENFQDDEEPENFESQKEDMKQYLNKLNKRIDTLVEALKCADSMMAKMGDQKAIIEQINNKKKSKVKNGAANSDKKSIAEYFREQINKKN